jgi:hypothetical protein
MPPDSEKFAIATANHNNYGSTPSQAVIVIHCYTVLQHACQGFAKVAALLHAYTCASASKLCPAMESHSYLVQVLL